MDSSTHDVLIFAETNLDTRFAFVASPDTTAGNLKREIESQHFDSFPAIGKIKVHRLKVKRRSHYFYLPETLPIKYAFQGIKGTWFLSLEASPGEIYDDKLVKGVAKEVGDHVACNNITGTKRKKVTKCRQMKRTRSRFYSLKFVLQMLFRSVDLSKKIKRRKFLAEYVERKKNECVKEQDHPCSLVETPCQTLSEPLSVSGIIKKYFSGDDEVTSRSSGQIRSKSDVKSLNIPVHKIPTCADKRPQSMEPLPFGRSEPSEDKLGKGEIGKALVLASNSPLMFGSKQNPMVSLCRLSEKKDSKSLLNSSLVRNVAFEINDEDD